VWETYVGKTRRFLGAIRSPNGAHVMLIKLGIFKNIYLVEISLILLENVPKNLYHILKKQTLVARS
jgi:hypothetical protein